MTSSIETQTFGVSPDEISAIDDWIEQIGIQWGKSQHTIFKARLCVAELAANVLEHGVSKSSNDYIEVTLCDARDGIRVEFLDSRGRFDPTHRAVAINARSVESIKPSGRGLMLLQAYANEMLYIHDGAHNRVTLKIQSA
jgi:anti-sigma regulatory factor (Ser/Thr protein kinase)